MTAVLTWSRLSFRIQRWEVLAATAGVALVVGGLAWLIWQLHGLVAIAPGCDFATMGPGCDAVSGPYLELVSFANRALQATALVPLGTGLILGVPLVAREIEHGTASITWSLVRSRGRWLLTRVAFAMAVVVALMGVIAIATELLAAAALPGSDLGSDFSWYGQRGELLLMRGIAALAAGLVLGAVVGRVLPALLVAGIVTLLAFATFHTAMERWLQAEAEVVHMNGTFDTWPSGKYLGPRTLTVEGELLTWEELRSRGIQIQIVNEAGEQFTSEADMEAGRSVGWDVQLIVPGERYREIVAREAALLGGGTLLMLTAAAVVVRRRRPY